MKFLNIFNEIQKGNYALTDEAIYNSIQNNDELIPLYGGNKEHLTTERRISISAKTKKGIPITVFSGEGIIISLDGSSGSMTYKRNEKFALNHHAGFITVREESKNAVDLRYFSIFMQNFYRSLSVSDGTKTLSLDQIYSEEINLPPYDTQMRILNKLIMTDDRLKSFLPIKQKYENLLSKKLFIPYKQYQAKNISIGNCIDYMSGTSELTEERNYLRLKSNGLPYQLLTGATTKNASKVVLSDEDAVKRFIDKEGLLVVRKGKAGLTRYLPPNKYVLNDDAYILFCKNDSPYVINLRWLSIQYRDAFLGFSSSSDNGTWNMTGFFKHVKIDIPSMPEQEYVVRLYEQIENRINAIQRIEEQVNELLCKEVQIA